MEPLFTRCIICDECIPENESYMEGLCFKCHDNFQMLLSWKEQGAFNITEVPNRGWCCLFRMAFTIGLLVDLKEEYYTGRYCYASLFDAINSLQEWSKTDGKADPPGNWIKYKGMPAEYSNPNYVQ